MSDPSSRMAWRAGGDAGQGLRRAAGLVGFITLILTGCGGNEPPPDRGAAGSGVAGPDPRGPVDRVTRAMVFEGARIVVGDGGWLERGTIVVEGGQISQVGPADRVEVPEDAVRTDLSGRTIIPALIDAHAHLGYEGYEGWGASYYSRDNLVEHLERYAYYGFGAVLSAGSDPLELALEIQRAQRDGEIGGARFLFAAGMAPPGQGPNDRFLEHTEAVAARTAAPVVRGIGSPEEGRGAVREVAERGIDFVKVWVDDRGGSQTKLSPEHYRSVIAEAHDRGLDVLVHQQSAQDMHDLIAAGVDGFLHGRLGPDLDWGLARRLADSGAFLVPNLGLGELRRERIGADPFLRDAVRAGVADRLLERPEATPGPASREAELGAALGRLIEAGATIVLGTDAGAIPDHFFGYTGHRELEILVRLGMTPMQALVAGTGAAAAALHLEDMGVLAPGLRADFVVLGADPLEDIRNTRRIEAVFLGGQRVDRDRLRAGWTDAR